MNPEDDLRRLARDDIWNDRPFHLRPAVARARPTARRGMFAVAATAAIVLAAGAGVLFISGVPAHHVAAPKQIATVVPWTDSAPPTAMVAAVQASALNYPSCTAADVTVTNTTGGKAMGGFQLPTTIRNTSPSPCSLTDADLRLLTQHDGSIQPIATTAINAGKASSIVLAPGATTHFQAAITGACTGTGLLGPWSQPVWLQVHGTLIRLHGVLLPTDARLTCAGINNDAGSSAYYRNDPEPAPTGPYTSARATITAPKTVTAGQTLNYTVTLTNTGRATLTFTDCPSYQQFATGRSTNGHRAETETLNTLNCSPAHPLKQGASTTFAMRIAIPANASPGSLKLSWLIGDQLATGTVLTVRN